MSPRALVVLTGSELVRGDIADANGSFLARELSRLGLEPERILIVGDRGEELESALHEGLSADLCVVSGGLGPTHDDRTIEVLARVAGRELRVDPDLEAEIERVSREITTRLRRPYAEFAPGVRKQASLPQGGFSLGLAGTAPGVVLEVDGRVAVALPGPPEELRRLWRAALESDPVKRVVAAAAPAQRHVLRFFGASESTVARALAEAGGEGAGVEATICARDSEVLVDLFADAEGGARAEELAATLRVQLDQYFFADDERSIEELVLELCRDRGLRLAAAESCTGGMVAERLTEVPGSSDVFRGAVVAYADDVKASELDVPGEVLQRHGAVSAETAAAMASGVRKRLGADIGVAVTGIAGPGGGTADKPVGLVYLHVAGPDGELALDLDIPGGRHSVRTRSTAMALHLVRRLLEQSRHERV
ncbi:MAG: competence/damage-inducible protein A [Actinomycetota bacterium]|nr:competence/damage-inducible protein A [Actinomycetota bacterium]